MQKFRVCARLGVALVCAGTAAGDVHRFEFVIDGLQETPPVNTPGSGFGIVEFDDVTRLLTWTITFQDLLGPVTAAHFHGPAPFGIPAGVRVDIGAISGLASPMVGSTTVSAAFGGELLDGLWYVNIHTTIHPAGEIRGQVVPAPAGAAVLAGAWLGMMRRRR